MRPPLTPAERRRLAAEARAGWPARRGGAKAIAARAAVARLLWRPDGTRRAPTERALDAALTALPRGELEWICEFSPLGPLYLLPTKRWLAALARQLRSLGARRVLEVAAGDGFLTRSLRPLLPGTTLVASDSARWERPEARMNASELKSLRNSAVPGLRLGDDVLRLEALAGIRQVRPDVVLASWLPPGPLLDKLIRAPVRHVLEIGAAGGVTPGAWSWRFAHDFCEGPIESLCRCRLDERPAEELHSRVTDYFGAAHPEHGVERVRRGDWLWQYRPTR
jgi:hypothetical protein